MWLRRRKVLEHRVTVLDRGELARDTVGRIAAADGRVLAIRQLTSIGMLSALSGDQRASRRMRAPR